MFEDNTPSDSTDNLSLSALFDAVLRPRAGQTVPIGDLVYTLHERGFGVLLILFSLPLCIPIPKPPPIDTILGIPLFYLSLQMILGKDRPSLPKTVLDKKIPIDLLLRAFTKGRKYLEWFEKLFRPRLTHVLSDHNLSRLCGMLGMLLTCSVLVPFPFSNTVPSLCMVVMATGIIARDGLAAIAAGIFGSLWVAGLATAVVFGAEFLKNLL